MALQSDCIFCKIIQSEIPSAKVYEDEHVLAFLDISQVTKGHTLIIPKQHHVDLFELPSETAAHLFATVPTIANAIQKAFQPTGLNLLNNNRKAAGQTVFHFHMHIIPRYGKEDGFGFLWEAHDGKYTREQLQDISTAIAQQLQSS
ncbi:HIT family protein [Aneurinibacillus terranovensis]|uniref:HIT family protein n=1 Tax=Aneurinibacillus terranovensis TaxID=278991 RepID=UPI0004178021|nr:HIT family protein [Aneurinibacillus terranovensis]